MEFEHVPVLYDEVMETLAVKPDGIYVDGTVGGGGHSSGICERLSEKGTLIAVDRDTAALEAAGKRLAEYKCNKKFIHANYSDVEAIAEAAGGKVDGILLDLGVSSFQLDNAERGFSYMQDAPMDMRMNEDDSFTAYDVVNTYSEKELTRIIREYGEEKWASRIAQFIVRARSESPIRTTGELTDIIKAAIPAKARRTGPHPAKRTFQAIRIEVNDELGHLREAVEKLPDLLESGGRIAIITFHSLEDRIVKQEFDRRLDPCTCPKEFPVCVCGKKADVKKVTRKPLTASDEELERNPRARSAKLRVIEKL
ncbi:MAG: 16S rRNA (cytosine(1402)-N(4))-methyltransferase RsmH [Mogibacterium sp.]|nr:16S rRNA (cytosine(1402)-N(4))-methyltransferase RsmH [Mogibacterium sp.]MBR2539591.1 16S rRNA (cytosine(1402)-N(4))-methyltransferase RsmH [Mogibacterium sp.]